MNKSLLTFLLCFLLNTALHAQEFKTITGQLIDESGHALPGVNILEKFGIKNLHGDAPNGTQTDFDGYFEIKIRVDSELSFFNTGISQYSFNPKGDEFYTLMISSSGITSRYWCCTSHSDPQHCDKKKSILQESHNDDEKYRLSNG